MLFPCLFSHFALFVLPWGSPTSTSLTHFLRIPFHLYVHCQSKYDDLENRTLPVGREYYWSFNPNFFTVNILFFCHFWWGTKNIAFDVYNERKYDCESCFWAVKIDGFYFNNANRSFLTNWERKYVWP